MPQDSEKNGSRLENVLQPLATDEEVSLPPQHLEPAFGDITPSEEVLVAPPQSVHEAKITSPNPTQSDAQNNHPGQPQWTEQNILSPSTLPSQVTSAQHDTMSATASSSTATVPREKSRSSSPHDEGNTMSFRAVAPVNISIQGLKTQIDLRSRGIAALGGMFKKWKKDRTEQANLKTILNEVSAELPNGSLTAIMGASGSGKTSLLNIMAERMKDGRLRSSGHILYNDSSRLSSVRSAYVMQQDVLLPTLTVRETLRYSADLRLPSVSVAERHEIVEEVILELGLKECADTRIGNQEHKGCSGGEKRRTSLGVQLLANPSVLFLDEVTTGLDANSAFQLVRTLKQLAQKGRTVIISIHQPRSEIWGFFDSLVLLAAGSLIFSGPTDGCLAHFEKLNHRIPAFVNPAEFLVDLAAIDTRTPELERVSLARVNALKEAWIASPKSTMPAESEKIVQGADMGSLESTSRKTSLWRQVQVQTARTLKTTWRDPMGLTGSLIEVLTMAIITGWIFLGLDGSLTGIRSREGALYTASALQGYLILLFETYRLTLDIGIFDREHSEGVVGVPSFLLSRRLARFFIEDIPIPLIYSVIFYFMAGFRHDAVTFFIFFVVNLVGQFLAVTFATLCVAISRDFAIAVLVANMNFTLQSMCSGFFVQSNQIPIYLRWLKYTAYVWYANGALCSNEFIGRTSDPAGNLYDCPYPGGTSNPACAQYTGAFVIASLGYPDNWVWRPVVILLGFTIVLYVLSGLILQFWKVDMGITRARIPTLDTSAGKEQMTTRSLEEVRTVEITLDQYGLSIQKRNFLGKATTIPILQPISAKFQPGVLNVIMGPSGSGKTSLLNMMACRLHSSFSTRYQSGGSMLYGGSVPSEDVIRSVASYVCQDDDALLPTLTVRETLHYAAGLRLPTWMSKEEKHRRAESVLLKLGLRDCADNMIGSEMVKGISGGEKRRVSIAVQVLTDPRVLLLDECTSGLDAFTASSIVDVLRGLAEEGKTLILTIHQSRSDLFKHFGNVLLLARGGYPVYAGKGVSMLSHFSALGYECPKATNPSDFALDLITVDLQTSQKEAATREKVRSLVSEWNGTGMQITHTTSHISAPAELGNLKRSMTPFHISFPLLVRRSLTSFKRDTNAIFARTTQVIGFAVIVTLFFAPLKLNYEGIQSRLGYIQEFAAIYFIGMLQNVAVYPSEKDVFYREHDDGAYSVEAFFLQYTVIEIPFEIVTSLIFSVLADMAAGLPRTPTVFFVVAFNCFCIVSCGESVGIMFNTLFNHTGFAVNFTSVILSIATLMAGVISLNVPPFLQAFNHLSPAKWLLGNLAPYSLQGVVFTCTDAQRLPNGNCPISTGEEALALYKLDTNPGLNLMALAICTVVYRVVAYLLLKAMRTHWSWKSTFPKSSSRKA